MTSFKVEFQDGRIAIVEAEKHYMPTGGPGKSNRRVFYDEDENKVASFVDEQIENVYDKDSVNFITCGVSDVNGSPEEYVGTDS